MALRDRRSRRGNYQGLETFTDRGQWQYAKNLDDRISRTEAEIEDLQARVAALEARPVLTESHVRQLVQQTVAAFAAPAVQPAPPAGILGETTTIPSDPLP